MGLIRLGVLVVRKFVLAERVLSPTSPRPEAAHGKARVGAHCPNINLLLPDLYRAVLERIRARPIGAVEVIPVHFHQLPSNAGLIQLQPAQNYIPWHASHEALKKRPTAAKLRSWRVSILRQRAQYIGIVKAPDARAAEAAAVAQFGLDDEQRKRLAVREEE